MSFISSVFNILIGWLTSETQNPTTVAMCDFNKICHELKPGDVVLVEGKSRVSRVIKHVTLSPWSHAFLYIGRLYDINDVHTRKRISDNYDGAPDVQLIIESEIGVGTHVCPLKVYKGEHLRICRPKGLQYEDSQRVVRFATSCLGRPYNVRQILDLMRFFVPYFLIPRRWRSSLFQYSPGEETKTVCSTMIAEAFSAIHFPILPLVKYSKDNNNVQIFQRNPKMCTPRDFDYSPYFEIIKYPFLDYHYYSDYKLLPWQGKYQLEGTEADDYMSCQDMDHLREMNKRNKSNF